MQMPRYSQSIPAAKLHEETAALAAAERELDRLQSQLSAQSLPWLQLVHELRSPLASILTTLGVLMQGGGGDNVMRQEMLRLARERAQAMLAMVNDFLHLGTMEDPDSLGEAHPVSVADALWRVVPELRIKAVLRGVTLDLHVEDGLPRIRANEEHVERLWYNLIDNAIKYTDPGGKVSVRLGSERNRVVGEVEDSGIGIAPEDMPRLYNKFFRARNAREIEPYGTGLGLMTVKRVVDLYGGNLRVESELKKGTKFWFTFDSVRGTA